MVAMQKALSNSDTDRSTDNDVVCATNQASCIESMSTIAPVRPAGRMYIANKTMPIVAGAQAEAMEVEQPPLDHSILDIDLPEDEAIAATVDEPPVTGVVTDANPLRDNFPAKWAHASSNKNIGMAIGTAPNTKCLQCGYTCTTRKRLLLHARIH